MVHSPRVRVPMRAMCSLLPSARHVGLAHSQRCSPSARRQCRVFSTTSSMAAQRSLPSPNSNQFVSGTISPPTSHSLESDSPSSSSEFDCDAMPMDISTQTSSHAANARRLDVARKADSIGNFGTESNENIDSPHNDAIEHESKAHASSGEHVDSNQSSSLKKEEKERVESSQSSSLKKEGKEHHQRRKMRKSLSPPGSLFQVFPCTEPGCQKKFVTNFSLDEHLQKHEERKRHKFHCELCPLTFEKKKDWTRHGEVHDDSRRFPCPVCGDIFTRESSLYAHLAKMGSNHESVKGSRIINITPEDMCNRDLFSSFEPIVEQRLQHATWPGRKETIIRTDVLLADQDEEFDEEFTGKLSLKEATPCAFFSIETVEGRKMPRIVQFPLSAEPNELLATLTVDLHRLLGTKDGRTVENTDASTAAQNHSLANTESRESSLGEYKMFFAGCSTPKRALQFKHSPVRFVVLLARREDWARAEAIGCVEMDPFENYIMRYDRDEGLWYRPGKYMPMPQSEISVIVAVANGVPNLKEVNAEWLDVAKIGFKHNSPLVRCPVCAQCVSGRKTALLHFAVHHEGLRFKCDECSLEFASKLGIETHISSIHQELRYKCEVCGKSYNTEMYLKNHMRFHKGEYKCDGCGKHFGNKNHLRYHNKRRVQCNICGEKLCYQDEQKYHFIVHHAGPEYIPKYPFKCSVCDFVSAYKQNIERHARSKHEETLDDVTVVQRRTGQRFKVKR